MCGRFALFSPREDILSYFSLKSGLLMQPRYNIAPTQTVPVIMQWGRGIEFCRWGFVPSWAKPTEETLPSGYINARFETLAEKPSFKLAYSSHRCLIPASGYFEWQAVRQKKQPFFISLKSTPLFAFAGLYSLALTPQGERVSTCAIVTQEAVGELKKCHERMPLVLKEAESRLWLQQKPPEDKQIQIQTDEDFQYWPVTTSMGNPRLDGPECIRSL